MHMIKKNRLKHLFIFITINILTINGIHAQGRVYFVITGKIITDADTLKSSSLLIEKNGKSPLRCTIPENGRFRLELDYNSEYTLTFSQSGHLAKTVKVNTAVPDDLLANSTAQSAIRMDVRLPKNESDRRENIQNYEIPELLFSQATGSFVRQNRHAARTVLPENNQ